MFVKCHMSTQRRMHLKLKYFKWKLKTIICTNMYQMHEQNTVHLRHIVSNHIVSNQQIWAPIISNLGRITHTIQGSEPSPPPSSLSSTLYRLFSVRTNSLPFPLHMSHLRATASESSSSNFRLIINNALKDYEKRTKENLLLHPLASQLQACDSPEDILTVLQQQILHQSRSTDERSTKWLDPTINVLLTFSQTVGIVGLVRHALNRDLHSHIYLTGILTGDCDLCGDWCSPFSVYPR
jgi:hypothetical protein